MHKTITRQQIADTLGVHFRTVQAWSADPDFPRYVAIAGITGRLHLLPVAPVCDWLQDNLKATPAKVRELKSLAREVAK